MDICYYELKEGLCINIDDSENLLYMEVAGVMSFASPLKQLGWLLWFSIAFVIFLVTHMSGCYG